MTYQLINLGIGMFLNLVYHVNYIIVTDSFKQGSNHLMIKTFPIQLRIMELGLLVSRARNLMGCRNLDEGEHSREMFKMLILSIRLNSPLHDPN